MEIVDTFSVTLEREIPEIAALMAGALQTGKSLERWWAERFEMMLRDRAVGSEYAMAVFLAKVFTRWQVAILCYKHSECGGWYGSLYLTVFTPTMQTGSTGIYLDSYHPTMAETAQFMQEHRCEEKVAAKRLVQRWYNMTLHELRNEEFRR